MVLFEQLFHSKFDWNSKHDEDGDERFIKFERVMKRDFFFFCFMYFSLVPVYLASYI